MWLRCGACARARSAQPARSEVDGARYARRHHQLAAFVAASFPEVSRFPGTVGDDWSHYHHISSNPQRLWLRSARHQARRARPRSRPSRARHAAAEEADGGSPSRSTSPSTVARAASTRTTRSEAARRLAVCALRLGDTRGRELPGEGRRGMGAPRGGDSGIGAVGAAWGHSVFTA